MARKGAVVLFPKVRQEDHFFLFCGFVKRREILADGLCKFKGAVERNRNLLGETNKMFNVSQDWEPLVK